MPTALGGGGTRGEGAFAHVPVGTWHPAATRGAQPWDRCPLTVAHLPAPLTGQSCLARYQWEEG